MFNLSLVVETDVKNRWKYVSVKKMIKTRFVDFATLIMTQCNI